MLVSLGTNGLAMLDNWLDASEVERLRATVADLESDPPRWARKPEHSLADIVHDAPLTARRAGDAGRIGEIEAAFNAPFLRQVCDGYLKRSWACDRVVQQRDSVREEAVTPWHVDHFPGLGKCLKFFIYLGDTTTENGAFQYVPGWHGLVREMSSELSDFAARRDALHVFEQLDAAASNHARRLHDQGRLAEAKRIDALLENTSRHISGNHDSDGHYAVPGKAGTVVVFDPAGLHRGHDPCGRASCRSQSLSRVSPVASTFVTQRNDNLCAAFSGTLVGSSPWPGRFRLRPPGEANQLVHPVDRDRTGLQTTSWREPWPHPLSIPRSPGRMARDAR
ncbi:MAG: hypothetical protein HOI34_06240 [Rhodospirillaceae bacterium]|nr:hypothetical protein [Rhodospirillaceae bacterium]